jgi:hypothetical protein
MLAMELSAKVRSVQLNQAPGVGGAFVALLLGEGPVLRSTDTFHIHANAERVIQFFCKVLFRSGCFLVNDFVGRVGFVMRSLEEEIAYRLGKRSQEQDITHEKSELLTFNSRAILLDVRSWETPHLPDVRIIENNQGFAMSFPDCPTLPIGSSPLPGSVLVLKTGSESLTLRVRSDETQTPRLPAKASTELD